jgi:hypothetical protein
MKSLRGSREEKLLLQRYTRQLDDQENRLTRYEKNSRTSRDGETELKKSSVC